MPAKRFHFQSLALLREELARLNSDIPFQENTEALFKPLVIGSKTAPNRIVFQPMEGCDAGLSGDPTGLASRRYQRFAEGAPGIIWLEAVAVCQEGRANPRQMMLCEDNAELVLPAFQKLIEDTKKLCLAQNGFEPLIILQLTHSGRYSKPLGSPRPIIACRNPILESGAISDYKMITDGELRRLEELFGQSARLAERAGADGVDIKCCHRYLLSELLSAYERRGNYGGSFENRTRLLRNAVAAAKSSTKKDFLVTSRLGVYDGLPYPYGFGVSPDGGLTPCMEEPLRLAKILHEELGMDLLNITAGNPYYNPNVNRPSDTEVNLELEPPLSGVTRILHCARDIQKALPNLRVVCSGLSYLREFAIPACAGMLEKGWTSLCGFGRQTFAYPKMIRDYREGRLDEKQCCVACGKCTELMRVGSAAGCVIRDLPFREFYKFYVLRGQMDPTGQQNRDAGQKGW